MSYILEALADSEKARLQIAAAPSYSLLPAVGEETPRSRVWPYLLAGALLANAAVLQLWLRPAAPGGEAAGREAPAANAAELAPREVRLPLPPAPQVHELRALPAPAPADPAPAAANPAASTAQDGAPIPLQKLAAKVVAQRKTENVVAAKAATAAVAASVATSVRMPATTVAAATPAPAVPVSAASAPAAPASASGSELPLALRPELPALAVAGFIRGEGSSSMVIVNDRLVREGDEVAPGVKLEKIAGDSLLFNYKGYRFKR